MSSNEDRTAASFLTTAAFTVAVVAAVATRREHAFLVVKQQRRYSRVKGRRVKTAIAVSKRSERLMPKAAFSYSCSNYMSQSKSKSKLDALGKAMAAAATTITREY